jgi:hypothetical protein
MAALEPKLAALRLRLAEAQALGRAMADAEQALAAAAKLLAPAAEPAAPKPK